MLVYDDAGDHAGLQAAEIIAATGARVEIMTPDRAFAPEVMAMNLVPYMRTLQKLDMTFTVTFRLDVGREATATTWSRMSEATTAASTKSARWTRWW